MDRLEFGCICELAEAMDNYVSNNISENEYPIASAYVNYNEAKALVDGAPKELKTGVPAAEAKEIEAKLKEAGATVELK